MLNIQHGVLRQLLAEISFQVGISDSFISVAALKDPDKSNLRESLLSWRRAYCWLWQRSHGSRNMRQSGKPEGPPPQWYISFSIAPPPKGSITSPTAPSSGGLVCKSISQWTTSHLAHSPSYILPATRREEVHLLGWRTDTLFLCVYYCHFFTFSIFWVMSLKLKLEAEH